ncbi:MAG: hypothetical protein JWP35_2516 [Caulobacter sp.]|nr:hypothetical protein [Caulobacter sp.]
MPKDINDPNTILVDRYVAGWNATDAETRRDLVAGAWTETGRYLDPVMHGEGHDGIDAMLAGVQQQFPGFVLRRTSPVDSHNGQVRFAWELGPEGGQAPVAGIDIGVVSDDGRLQAITGFLDRVP